MEIRTERLVLRPVAMGDVYTTHAYAGDAENTGYMMFLPYASVEETEHSIIDAIREWESDLPKRLEFAVLCDGEHIGGITLYYLEDRTNGELGWVLRRDRWGRGYITEAARGLMDYASANLGMRRIIACCDSENMASRRVAEKLGMRHCDTGTRKNRSSGDEERVELTYEIYV